MPADYRTITGAMAGMRALQGDDLNQDTPYAVVIARDLAKQLDLAPTSDAVVMATTLDGQMNALDIHISGTYDTGSEATPISVMMRDPTAPYLVHSVCLVKEAGCSSTSHQLR